MSKIDKQHQMVDDFWEILKQYKKLPSPQYPIYVLSKGRATTAVSPKDFSDNDIPFWLAVEPQEADEYRKAFPKAKIIVLEKSDQGVAYVRNAIKEHARKSGAEYHWQVDDDIKKLAYLQDGKNHYFENIAQGLSVMENVCDLYENIGGASARSMAFSRTEKYVIGFNRSIYCVALLNNHNGVSFRENAVVDIDNSLQILTGGECTVLFNRILFSAPSTGTQSGGCTENEHTEANRERRAKGLQENWPGAFKLRETKQGIRVSTSRIWQTFIQRPIKKGGQKMNIHKTINDLVVDIDSIKPYHKNPRKGNLEELQTSLKVNGQYRPIVVNKKTKEILAGNHTWQAAKLLGWKKIAATFVNVDDEQAKKIVLIDNKANDDATYNNDVLKDLLEELESNLEGTGYSENDLNKLLAETMEKVDAEAEWENMPEFEQDDVRSAFKVIIHFPTDEDADKFFEMIKKEKKNNMWWPDTDGRRSAQCDIQYINEEDEEE